MTDTESATHPEAEVERLLRSLAGIVSARVISDPLGRGEEIHVLASDRLHPKQVVRNVESALSAGLGIVIDRRVVSVAQVRADEYRASLKLEAEPAARPAFESPPAAHSRAPADAPAAAASAGWAAGERAGAEAEASMAALPLLAEERYLFIGYDVRNQT